MREINNIAVIGSGTMGTGIAQVFACCGHKVSIFEIKEEARISAKNRIKESLLVLEDNGKLAKGKAQEISESIIFTDTLKEAIKDADYITEAIAENAEIKKAFYEELKDAVNPNTIIASNTSALNIFELVPDHLLDQLLIVHWYSPADLVPLIEVVKSDRAPEEMADAAVKLLKDCGKCPVLMKKYIQGYIINRLQQCINREIFYLIDNGYCTAEDIDFAAQMSMIPRAMVLGFCKKIDFSGVDMSINNIVNGGYTLPEDKGVPNFLKDMQKNGELGIKSGKGFYDYTDKDINAVYRRRDEQLEKAYDLVKEFMDDPV